MSGMSGVSGLSAMSHMTVGGGGGAGIGRMSLVYCDTGPMSYMDGSGTLRGAYSVPGLMGASGLNYPLVTSRSLNNNMAVLMSSDSEDMWSEPDLNESKARIGLDETALNCNRDCPPNCE